MNNYSFDEEKKIIILDEFPLCGIEESKIIIGELNYINNKNEILLKALYRALSDVYLNTNEMSTVGDADRYAEDKIKKLFKK